MHTFIAICGILKLRVAKQNEKVDILKDKWDEKRRITGQPASVTNKMYHFKWYTKYIPEKKKKNK